MTCAIEILNKPIEVLRADLCTKLNKGENCEFTDDDKLVAIDMINQQALDCTKTKLAADNYCTDKVTLKGLMK